MPSSARMSSSLRAPACGPSRGRVHAGVAVRAGAVPGEADVARRDVEKRAVEVEEEDHAEACRMHRFEVRAAQTMFCSISFGDTSRRPRVSSICSVLSSRRRKSLCTCSMALAEVLASGIAPPARRSWPPALPPSSRDDLPHALRPPRRRDGRSGTTESSGRRERRRRWPSRSSRSGPGNRRPGPRVPASAGR